MDSATDRSSADLKATDLPVTPSSKTSFKERLVDFLAILGSFLVIFGVLYKRVSNSALQQASGVLLVLILILLNRVPFYSMMDKGRSILLRGFFLTLSGLFVQVLILATGGFYSPFLILIHLFAIGVSFLLSLFPAALFLTSALLVLGLNILLNPVAQKLFRDDPGSVLLYSASFVVIIPLILLVNRYYKVKDVVLELLNREVKLSSSRQDSLFSGINELVFVTDRVLNLVTVNGATERFLRKSEMEIIGKGFLEVVNLKDVYGVLASRESLSVDRVIEEKTTRIINEFYLYKDGRDRVGKVSVQIRPIIGVEGEVNQLVIVITDSMNAEYGSGHVLAKQVIDRSATLAQHLKKSLSQIQRPDLESEFLLYVKSEEDLMDYLEIEDHPIKSEAHFEDIALLCKKLVDEKQTLANGLAVSLTFSLPENEIAELALLKLYGSAEAPQGFLSSSFNVPIDSKWMKVAIDKLLDLGMLLSSSQSTHQVNLRIMKSPGNIDICLSVKHPAMFDGEKIKNLFEPYYNELGSQTNLKLGSGLEGYIVKTVADQLNIPLKAEYRVDSLELVITLTLNFKLKANL